MSNFVRGVIDLHIMILSMIEQLPILGLVSIHIAQICRGPEIHRREGACDIV